MATNRDIAIVGMSCHFPGANNIHEFWNNIANGVDSIIEAPNERINQIYIAKDKKKRIDRFYFSRGGFISPIKFDPIQHGLLPISIDGIDIEHLISLHLVKEALKDAGVFKKNISLQNCCYILGKGNFGSNSSYKIAEYVYQATYLELITEYICPDATREELEKIKLNHQEQLGRYEADAAFGAMSNIIASLASNRYNMQGPAYTIDAACASSLIAVEHAINFLLSNQCDIALAGGMHLVQGPSFWSIFNLIGAASYKGEISPFSEGADGLLIGEGAGIVVLKRLDKAIADNDRIYAVIKACSSCSDGGDVSVMAPSSKGQAATMKLAWDKAKMDPRKIGYIEAHGTATQVGDRVEIASLTEFFGDNTAPSALLGSVKSNIGHIMPASGIAGLIKTALALYHRKIPPTLHCEKPMKAMYNSRFMPAQELIDWDGENYPLVAGVNSFGFGGINSHAILEPYFYPDPTSAIGDKMRLITDRVISLSAKTKEELLTKLENENYTVSEGNYRLVIFNPNADKLNKAKALIEKDKPWKGRLDIWFSNKPLLDDTGKLVFMFTGFDIGTEIETQTISDYFNIELKKVEVGKDAITGRSINHFYRSQFFNQVLKKTNITPDINIGHSVGEWLAAAASDFVTPDSIEKLFEYYDPEVSHEIDVIYIAVGCGYDRIKSFCNDIPELYLANDNCPNQILMAGRENTIEELKNVLTKEQIYYQILPFKSAQHTPLFPEKELEGLLNLYDSTFVYQEGNIPLWSSTILDEYPKNKEEFFNLLRRQLKEPVRFRELIEKLYEQANARVFIQVGVGPLTGFVEDTLKDKQVSIISTVHSHNSAIEQLRRIVALLFIEGRTINEDLIGIERADKSKRGTKIATLNFVQDLIRNFPVMKEVIEKYSNRSKNMLPDLSNYNTEDLDDPVLKEVIGNLQEIAALQEKVVEWYKANQAGQINKKATIETSQKRAGNKVEKTIRFNLTDHPYLLDHMVVHQPANRPLEELNPVVPMAMTIETLCEFTKDLVPDKKVLKISSAGVLKWIQVVKPFEKKALGIWKTDDCISWMLTDHAYGDFTIGNEYPVVPDKYKEVFDLGDNFSPIIPDRKKIYSYFMFHGPKYQTILEVTNLSKKGIRALVRKEEGKGSLFDNLGQLTGLYAYMIFDNDQSTFPMNVDEIIFYQDFYDQEGIFEFNMLITDVKEHQVGCNFIIKRDGKIWAVVNGWRNRRLNYHQQGMKVVIYPTRFYLAQKLSQNVFFYFFESDMNITFLDFLYERYLNLEERKHFNSLYLNQARSYLISRVALKDTVRVHLQKNQLDDFIYPIEISVRHDEKGKPHLYGHKDLEGVEISLAHKGNEAVAIASDKPVGIDIEKIEERSKDFMDITFTPHEQKLLKDKGNEAEWATRFWAAKEAYGKMLGLGLQGNPKKYEVESIAGDDLLIKNTVIKTVIHRNDFIVGWTE